MTKKESIEELQARLEEIIVWFESDQATVDAALEKFEEGQRIIDVLKKRLDAAELRVNKVLTKET